MPKPNMALSHYTHEKLIARGYFRTVHKDYPGWVTYEKPGMLFGGNVTEPKVGFAGNDATMNNWIEEVSLWKKRYPAVYEWWGDPKQKMFYVAATRELLIKGEDPMLTEGPNGSKSSES